MPKPLSTKCPQGQRAYHVSNWETKFHSINIEQKDGSIEIDSKSLQRAIGYVCHTCLDHKRDPKWRPEAINGLFYDRKGNLRQLKIDPVMRYPIDIEKFTLALIEIARGKINNQNVKEEDL